MTLILPHRGQVIRRVSAELGNITVVDLPLGEFRCNLVSPDKDTSPELDESPRELSPYKLQFGPDPLTSVVDAPQHAGERVVVGAVTYELLGHPRQIKSGRRSIGQEVALLPIDVLYPLRGSIQERASDPPGVEVDLAMWLPSEEVRERGSYETYEAEAPIHHKDVLGPNKFLLSATGQRFHISRCYVTYSGPRVRMTLRKKDET